MSISEKVKELSEEIRKTEKFKKYQEARVNFEKDQQARSLLENFQKAKAELAILREGRFDGVAEQHKKTEKLSREVLKNKTIENYMKARKEYEGLVGELAVAISKGIDFPIRLPEKKSRCGR